MSDEILVKYNTFRTLCLKNAEDAIATAENLQNKSVNHIAFQLLVFGLEEIGKIFVGWYQMNAKETWGKEHYDIPLDDHIKKLFWCIWGASFASEKFTKQQMDEMRNLATNLHNKRLDVMYTELDDTVSSSEKISNEELEVYLKMSRSRLEMAKLEGEVSTNISPEKEQEMKWFMEITNHPEKRKFVFGNLSQDKLIEFGEVNSWISWLKEHFEKEDKELKELLQKELERSAREKAEDFKPKWKIRFKIHSPSHSIRANVLNRISSNNPFIKFSKGGDSHTLLVDIVLGNEVTVQELWHRGWLASSILVAALNVGSNGLFYWNLSVDIDKYYEQIWDLEKNRRLEAKLQTSFQLDWSSKQMYLREEEIAMTFLVFRYFTSCISNKHFEAMSFYMDALGMLAKNDMHLRLEPQCLIHFYLAFKTAIRNNEEVGDNWDIKEIGYRVLEKLLTDRVEFDKVLDLAMELENNNGKITRQFSLTEIIGMKQYAGLYFVTLAARQLYGDKAILLTKEEGNANS